MQTTIVKCTKSVTTDEGATSDHLCQLCRFCAEKRSCMIPIFREQGLIDDLPSKIKAYVPIEVSENDTLPLQVCSPCVQHLTIWHEFITGCLKADENLRAIYQEMLKTKADRGDPVTVAEERGNQQITEGRTCIQQQDGRDFSTEELTVENKADAATKTGSYDRYNTYSPDRSTFEINKKNMVSDTSKKRPTIENERKTVTDDDVCLRRPTEKNHSESHIMQRPHHRKIKNITGESDCECHIKYCTIQNTTTTATVTDLDKINTSGSECPEMLKDKDQAITVISKQKQMLNLCSSEHTTVGELKKRRKCDGQEYPGHGKSLCIQSDIEEVISNQNSKSAKQNPTLGSPERHAVSKPDEKSFRCSDCGKVFLKKDCFHRHLRIHTDERPFTCHICGKGFRDSGGLTRHLRDVHARVKNFKCDICGSLFAAKATCDDHRRTHTGERPFVCAVCGKRFSSRASLYMHAKTHTDVFPFSCNFCEKRFRRRQELRIHKMTHTGERPCACDICGREFRVSGELQRHKLVHSEDKPFCCAACGMSFKHKRYLEKHFKKTHKDI